MHQVLTLTAVSLLAAWCSARCWRSLRQPMAVSPSLASASGSMPASSQSGRHARWDGQALTVLLHACSHTSACGGDTAACRRHRAAGSRLRCAAEAPCVVDCGGDGEHGASHDCAGEACWGGCACMLVGAANQPCCIPTRCCPWPCAGGGHVPGVLCDAGAQPQHQPDRHHDRRAVAVCGQ